MIPIRIAAKPAALARRRRLLLCAIIASPWVVLPTKAAQEGEYPNRPVRVILASTVGGTSDQLARIVAARLEAAVGQPIVIEARPGAAGRIAFDYVANAAPDGYTLLLATNGANAIGAAEGGAGSSVEPALALAPVTRLVRLPIVVAVSPALHLDNLSALIARARNAPGKLSYASGGIGSTSHLAADVLFRRAGVRLVHIPYAGTSAALKDVLSGEVPVLFTTIGTVAALLQAGKLRGLAVTGEHRAAEFPALPTVAEAGYPGFDITTWLGIAAPPGTPRPIIVRLHDELVRILADPDVRAQLVAFGMEPLGDTPEQFASALNADARRWAQVIRADGATTR